MSAKIKIDHLSKTFLKRKNESLTVLDDVNLVIEEGDIFGIIGMSGAGKSTLIRCINHLEKPTLGNVEVNGIRMDSLDRIELRNARRNIGMIFQGFNLLMQKSVRKNIAFGLEIIRTKDYLPEGYTKEEYQALSYLQKSKVKKEDIRKTVDSLLKVVDLEDKADAYPASLSGGQKQRVAIARALATYPSVLLCDEATSALDSMTTKSILALLKRLNKERHITIVIITHELNVIKEICNKVAVIDKAVIAETGDVSDIFTNPKSEVTRQLIGGSL